MLDSFIVLPKPAIANPSKVRLLTTHIITKVVSSHTLNMMKTKPSSIRRRSFGGQSGIGIWWRKRSVPASILSEEEDDDANNEIRNLEFSSDASVSSIDPRDEGTSGIAEEPPTKKKRVTSATKKAPSSSLFMADEEPILGWDDDLCRPIYHRNESYRDPINTIDSFDEELVRAVSSGDTGVAECAETDISTEVVDEDLSKSSQDDSILMSPSAPTEDESSTAESQENIERVVDGSFRIPSLKKTRTFGDRSRRRRPLSLILMQDDDEETPMTMEQGSRRVSVESSADIAPTEEQKIASDATIEEATPQPKKGRRSKRRSNDPSKSLEKAREYFANLDQTQALTLDATSSPPVSSRVTRTSRRTNLASPGMQEEYKAYVESMAGDGTSGISPLSIEDYASSRKLHFESKGKLVDGFLDD